MAALPYRVSVSRTVAAAGDYADNDILSNSATNGAGTAWEFVNATPRSGGVGEIFEATLKCSAGAVVGTTRLHLFDRPPTTSEMDDNAALNMTTADRPFHIGWIDFAALQDVGDYGMIQATGLSQMFWVKEGQTGASAKSLWGILQITDAETNESAGMTIEITLGMRPY